MEGKSLTQLVEAEERTVPRLARRAGVGATLLAAAGMAFAACDNDATGPDCYGDCLVEREGPLVERVDTVFVPQVDTVFVDTGRTDYLATIPFTVEPYRSASLCPPEAWDGNRALLRFDLSIRSHDPDYNFRFHPAPFSNGCPEFKVANLPETAAIGYVLNGHIEVVDNQEHPLHGTIVEGVYINPVQADRVSPASVLEGAPNFLDGWNFRFSRWVAPNPGPFVRGSRDGKFDWVVTDRLTGREYTSAATHDLFIPFSEMNGYVSGLRPVFHENTDRWVEQEFDDRQEMRDFILDYVRQTNQALVR
jgi:hypothetical protein